MDATDSNYQVNMEKVKVKGRMKGWREKVQKNNPNKWKECQEKDKNRNRLNRENQRKTIESDPDLLAEKRKKDRERQALYRRKKKETAKLCAPEDPKLGTYRSPRTLGKAVSRVKSVLPKSPGKKKVVMKHLLEHTFGPHVVNILFKSKKAGSKKLTNSCIDAVKEFYCRDDISRQAPGKRDVKSVKDAITGKRTLKQIRHLVMGIKEVYAEFKKTYPQHQISLSKFYDLRPQHIRPVSEMPHTVCACKYHANFSLLLESISKCDNNIPSSHKEMLSLVSCDQENDKCMFNICKKCKYDVTSFLKEDNLNSQIKWKQWINDDNKRPKLCEHVGTVHEAVKELNSQLEKFKIHTFIKRKQSSYFDTCKKDLMEDPHKIAMQVDFAENYALIEQDEIQSAHWNHSQTTIFTCCVWHLDREYSFAVVSDDLSHSKYAVWVFVKEILHQVKLLLPNVQEVVLFSDNCAGQFKSKYTVTNICFEKDFDIKISEWNFFAASHGKGAVDGVGGSLKRTVWQTVKGRQAQVSTAEEFYTVLLAKCKTVKVLYVSKETVDLHTCTLDERWSTVSDITGIRSMHHFRVYDDRHILISRYSGDLMEKVRIKKETLACMKVSKRTRLHYREVYSSDSSDENIPEQDFSQTASHNEASTSYEPSPKKDRIKPGTYVLVRLISTKGNEFKYVGVCQSCVKEDDVTVTFLKTYGEKKNQFVIDDKDERIVSFRDIISIIKEPNIKTAGNTLIHEFSTCLNVNG